VAIDFDSRAPLAYRPDASGNSASYESGYLAVSVPAVAAGLGLALERFGTLSWATVSEPAIALAEHGVVVSEALKRELENWARKTDPTSLRALFPDGRMPEVGSAWVQPDIARLLHRLAREGPRAFYQGDIPRTIVRQVRENGGILAEEDFERYRAEVVEPLAIDYRGYRVLTPPLPSGGLTSLQILKTLESFRLAELEPWGAEYLHLFAEAAKLAWRDRARYFGDPDVTAVPVERLLAPETAAAAAAQIRRGGVVRASGTEETAPAHTANVLAADGAGNVVSLTATQGGLYGSGVAIDGLGLVMGHGMSRFELAGESPNAPAAGKRMVHFMAPTLIVGPGPEARGAVGLPGGRKILTVTAQLVVSLLDFRADPPLAVKAGRAHVETDEPLCVSSAVSDAVIARLQALGHTVRRGQEAGGPPDEIGGTSNALWIGPDTGRVTAASQSGETATAIVET
jgi:gamma-glutamyltranspeptidase/glutathione hydrolase